MPANYGMGESPVNRMEPILRRRVESMSGQRPASTAAAASGGGEGLRKSSSRKSITSVATNGDVEAQPRTRLMTLSGIRQLRSGSCSGQRPNISPNKSHSPAGSPAGSGTDLNHKKSVTSVSTGVLPPDALNCIAGLSTIQVEVLRQISLENMNNVTSRQSHHSTAPAADVSNFLSLSSRSRNLLYMRNVLSFANSAQFCRRI